MTIAFFPSLCQPCAARKMSVAFDSGRLSSDGGVLLLLRDPARIEHEIAEMLRLRMFLIAAGYEDADDCDALCEDPVFKLAIGRLPETGPRLCSQPTMSRLENVPSKIAIARMMRAMVDLFCASWERGLAAMTLDIDDTLDRVHGQQQLSLFNAHYDERCFLPIHIYEAGSGKPVAVILRPGKTPSGAEVRAIVKQVVRRIWRHWPQVRICWRGDSHYARPGPWTGAKKTASISSSDSPATTSCTPRSATLPTICACAASRPGRRSAAPGRHSPTPPGAGPKAHRVIARLEASSQGARCALRRHHAQGFRRAPLRDGLLRVWPGRELHQAAQDPARLGPHLLP
jgi:DDE family transposase